MAIQKREFIISQSYEVTIDKSAIDRRVDKIGGLSHDEKQEECARFHRMFHAIMSDEKALNTIAEYIALAEFTSETGGGDYVFRESHYGDKHYTFTTILSQIAHIFTQEDREWWLGLVELDREERMKDEEEGGIDLSLQVEALEDCFQAEHSWWNIQEHLCARR